MKRQRDHKLPRSGFVQLLIELFVRNWVKSLATHIKSSARACRYQGAPVGRGRIRLRTRSA